MRHVPVQQASLPPIMQRFPHLPQWSRLVNKLVSQPVAALRSQSPRPALQDTTVHVPLVHVPTPPVTVHGTRQPPQFSFVSIRVSQPSVSIALQSPNPALQRAVHDPVTHSAS